MVEDPDFHLNVGRLVGAAELAAVQLQAEEPLTVAQLNFIGRRIDHVVEWFLDREKDKDTEEKPYAKHP